MGRFFKIIIMIMVITGVVYLGACVYANFIQRDTGEYKIPSEKQAEYEILIVNTGNIFYTDEYDIVGTVVNLYGYWELIGERYKFRTADLPLDERDFGEIIIRRR